MGKMLIGDVPGNVAFTISNRCSMYFDNLFHTFKNLLQQLYMFKCLGNITC